MTLKLIITFFVLTSLLTAQETSNVHVHVFNKVTNEPLPFANVVAFIDGRQDKGHQTDMDGLTKFPLKYSKAIVLSAVYTGCRRKDTIVAIKSASHDIKLYLDTASADDYRNIYNRETAYSDLKKGQVNILYTGLTFNHNAYNKCCMKYGFKYIFTTDVISGHIYEAVENYNAVVIHYLDLVNGTDWVERLKKECGITIK